MTYRYIGNGAYLVGVPARDLTVDEWAALDDETRATALALKLYEKGTKREPVVTVPAESDTDVPDGR